MSALLPDVNTRCAIAGGGPAGMVLGLLLARAGIRVTVLEKHADFLRDFRGDTVHPSTLEVMHELGLLEAFLKRPHQELRELRGEIAGQGVRLADFSRLPTQARFIVLMPQWDFLDFIAAEAHRYPLFELRLESEVVGILREGGRVTGLEIKTAQGAQRVRSDLTIGADGRGSLVRQQAGLRVQDLGAPMDVLWMKLPRRTTDDAQTAGYVQRGRVLVLLDRGDYWQCAFVIPKGQFESLAQEPITALHRWLESVAPFLRDRTAEIASWQDVRLLTVRVDRLEKWYQPGLLCIGDAAHAMSPVGGVGINLAIQDAVAAANLLLPALRRGVPTERDLARVQRRRELPTRLTQAVQLRIQNGFIAPGLAGGVSRVPWLVKLIDSSPSLRGVVARAIGLGARPEHVSAPLQN